MIFIGIVLALATWVAIMGFSNILLLPLAVLIFVGLALLMLGIVLSVIIVIGLIAEFASGNKRR